MINSLSKDSHITQRRRSLKMAKPQEKSILILEKKSTPAIKYNTSVNKPAKISFSGLSSRTLANDASFKRLYEIGKEYVGQVKHQHKETIKLIKDSVDLLIPDAKKDIIEKKHPKKISKKQEPSQLAKTFAEKNKEMLLPLVKKATDLTKHDNLVMRTDPITKTKVPKLIDGEIEYRANPEEMREEIISSVENAAKATTETGKKHWYKDNKALNYFLLLAEKNNVAFSATFALLLTCILRPASIMTLPGNKKNKDDQKYAATHSIASGIIGYVCAYLVSNPVATAMKKVLSNPLDYMRSKKQGGYGNYIEDSKKANGCADVWISRGVDIAMAVPKALITIALIPPILKYVFGWEKKKSINNNKIEANNKTFASKNVMQNTKIALKPTKSGTK